MFTFIHVYTATAQQRCGTVEYTDQLLRSHNIPENTRQFEQWLAQKKSQRLRQQSTDRIQETTYQIPVVVHVIHNGEAVGTGTNIPDAQILSQIKVLNKDYQRLNADASNTPAEFQSVAGNMSIEFVLAKRTPDGFATNGIVRVKGTQTSWTSGDNTELKSLSYWSSDDYLNIWVCNLTDYLGYAQFPVSDLPGLEDYQNGLAATDGAVFNYQSFGSIDDGAFSLKTKYNKGRTATHELGHFFGLRHLWGDVSNCNGTDYINDTPPQDAATFNCPTHPQAACNATKMFQNYLDYTDDACMNLFTQDQVTRMITVLENSPRRTSLLTSPGLLDPTASGNDLLIEEIIAPSPVTCKTEVTPKVSVKVNNSIETITSFKLVYTINGASVAVPIENVSLEENDVIEIALPAAQLTQDENELSFEVQTPNGGIDVNPFNNSKSMITVINTQQDNIPLRQNFEGTRFSEVWTLTNPSGGTTWQTIDLGDNTALYANGFTNTTTDNEMWLVSPVLDFTTSTSASVSFDLSYAYRSGKFDGFRVIASKDCGTTFPLSVLDMSGPNIASHTSAAAWQPASDSDWTLGKNLSLSALAGQDSVRLAFIFTNQNGNNLYLDNIEFFQYENPPAVTSNLVVYPNCVTTGSLINVRLNLPQRETATLYVTDMTGRIVHNESISEGLNQTYSFYLDGVRPGMYIAHVTTNTRSYSAKLIVR
ncbi:M43 family zinc metalloprotease [Ohtaekwangia sp.]|uniref:M43 family zinc metalloprotease n=1 Tax=Ohtaekwangia sp. TaxID=2066019 RepID=UPI002F953ACA